MIGLGNLLGIAEPVAIANAYHKRIQLPAAHSSIEYGIYPA